MKYDLSNSLHLEQFRTRAALLVKAGKIVELKVCHPNRTRRQNSFLHAALGYFAAQTGCTLEYVKQEYYKRLVNRDIFCREIYDRFAGHITVLRSSSTLTTDEMSHSIERFRNWAASEAGIYIPSPDDTRLIELMEMETERSKQWI